MIKDNIEMLTGNDRYEGYNIDLIDAIAKELKFNYTIQIVADSQYGKKLENGSWNGMINLVHKELVDIGKCTTMYINS